MIELDVAAKRRTRKASTETKNRYLVLGDFGGRITEPVSVDRNNLEDILSRLGVNLAKVQFRRLGDFHPDRLYQRLDIFRDIRESAKEVDLPSYSNETELGLDELLRPTNLLERIDAGDDPFQNYLRDLSRAQESVKVTDPQRVSLLEQRMRAILHHSAFQRIEATWRGLEYVVRHLDEDASVIHIVQLSREDLDREIKETEIRSTRLYSTLYAGRWKAVIGLYTFESSPSDIDALRQIALLAANVKAPFIAAASVDSGERWEKLRTVPGAKYLGLALPRFLLRLPYDPKFNSIESFDFKEVTEPLVHENLLWGNPALACLNILTREVAEGTDELELTALPLHSYKENGSWATTPCGEIVMTELQVMELIDLGLIPLVSFRDSNRVRIAGLRAINGRALAAGR